MSESNPPNESEPQAKTFQPIVEDRGFAEMLESQLGKIFLVATPESFEEGGLGPQIREGYYPVKLVGLGKDYLITVGEFQHGSGKKASKEPMRQYIPLTHIKRITLMKSERLLHL